MSDKTTNSSSPNFNINSQEQDVLEHESLGEKLQTIINSLPEDKLTLAEIHSLLGQDGMLMFTALLTIIFLIPVSIPGVSTIFGGAILLIGISLLFNRNLWLPESFLRKELPAQKLRIGLQSGFKWFQRLEKISKPHRLKCLSENRPAKFINGLSIILGALLLMMPFGLIPFSNTLPAMALLLFSIGILQKDGYTILLGHLMNIATIIYFAALISGSGFAIHEILKKFA